MEPHRKEPSYSTPLLSPLIRGVKNSSPVVDVKILDLLHYQLEEEIKTSCLDRRIRVSIVIFQSLCSRIISLKWVVETSWRLVYVCLDFPDILRLNEEACRDITQMVALRDAIGLLFRYGVNLLKPDVSTSTAWRVISFDNSMYSSKVNILKGHKQILYLYGYTKELSYGLSYPDALHTPNIVTVAKVAADLAIAYFEIDMYISSSHPHAERIGTMIQSATNRTQTSKNPDKHTVHVSPSYRSHSSESSVLEEKEKESMLHDVRNEDNPLLKSSYQTHEPEGFPKVFTAHMGKEKQSNIEQKQAGQINMQSSSQSSPLYNQVRVKLTKCGICKQNTANVRCTMCSQPRCKRCDELWHKHPQRQGHTRHQIIPEELEAPRVLQPDADISQRHAGALVLPPVIDKATIRETRLPGGISARTDELSTIPEASSSKEMTVLAGTNGPLDSPQLQQGLELMAEAPSVNCDFCSTKPGKKFCASCEETYCLECDDKRHSNQRRKSHKRQDVTQTPQPGSSSDIQTMLPDQDPFQLPKNVELDSLISNYYSVPGEPAEPGDASYFTSEEDLDVRAPPTDSYRQPMLGAGVQTKLGHKSPNSEESPYVAPQDITVGGTSKEADFQTELGIITAEDIATLEKLFSVRGLRENEMDPIKRAELMREEQKLTTMHEELERKLIVLQGQSSGTQRASPQKVPTGAAIAAGAAMTIPQGKVIPSVTSAGNMASSTSPREIRQQIPDPAKAPKQKSRDILQDDQEGWTCQHCTFLNTNMESNVCSMCDKTSFLKAKIQPTVRSKKTKPEQSNSKVEIQPLTKVERRKKNAEYYQQLEAEMLAEKQHAKEEYSRNPGSLQADPTGQEPKKAVVKSRPLSDTDLLELSQAISSTGSFTKLGFELGFSHHELNRLKVRDPTGTIGASTYEMLKMWQGDVRGHEQRPKLKQALVNADLRAYVDFFDENRFTKGPDEPRVSSPRTKAVRDGMTPPSIMSTPSGMTTSGEVSDEDLLLLSREIPVDKIHDLGFELRFPYSKVQHLLHMHRMDAQDAILNMLQEWKSRTTRADQRRELNNILKDSSLGGLTLTEAVSKPNIEAREPRGITDMELYELADSLNASNITHLGLYLGFGMAAITRYQHEAALGSPREGTTRLLMDWRNHKPEIDQREFLANVLYQIGCERLGEKIKKYSGFTRHHDTFEESLLQQQLSHATSFGDLSYLKGEEKTKYEEMRTASLNLIAELREAESQGIPPGRIQCALYIMEETGDDLTDPIAWIADNWSDVVQDLATKATQELRENLEVDVDTKIMELVQLSEESAEKCLEECSGNTQEAIKECTQRIQEKILEIQEVGSYSVDDIVAILKQDDVRGDPEKALDALQVKAMAEYVDRVWTPTHDDDNEYFQEAIKNDDRSIRMLMVEYNMRSWGRAQTAAKLIIRKEFLVDDVVTAAEECGDLRRSEVFLKQMCSVCYIDLPRNKLMSLINCQCMMCRDCVIEHFEIIAKDKSIMKGKCPHCDQPDLDDPAVAADYFAFLDILLRDMLSPDVYELFQRKLRDWNLMQDKNFCWCAHCNSGFINGAPDRRKMRCPECNKLTCFHCKKQWMDQHEGISCEAFQQWKENNDPDLQAQGLAAHLNENGIECPRCKMRFELAKGGCMHFKCPQCTFEFCCGCSQPMKRGDACHKFGSCLRKGLHAHHPRDCLFYLRDEDVNFLQKLLDDAGVEYNKELPEGAEENEEGVCGSRSRRRGPLAWRMISAAGK
eukprot:XP_011665882.1 PREDICTED: uncharacterized protein LOC100892326 isoform X1 [Strongylocentrotus purpuratus]